MSQAVQDWILRRKGFVTLINDKLANRGGVVGKLFTWLKVGPRQLGEHTVPKLLKFINFYYMASFQLASTCRPVFSRFIGSTLGPLNFTGIFMWFWMTGIIVSRIKWNRGRDLIQFNNEDGPEFWYRALGMMFPANYMNNKVSAHYLEINQIYTFEMFKRYRAIRKEMLEERSSCSDKEKRTRYITNPNYIYEPLGDDTIAVKSMFKN